MMTDNDREREEYVSLPVWDIPTRLLHWLNALIILSLAGFALTLWRVEGLHLEDEISEMLLGRLKRTHTLFGYALAVTFTLRMIWGVAGNRYARFSDFISLKGAHWAAVAGNIRWYLGGFRGHPPVAVGHNPLAALFYLPLFAVLVMQVLTGLLLAGLEYEHFPGPYIVERYGYEGVDAIGMVAERLHVFGLYFILFFIAAHLTGLVVHELGERCGLFSSMISGRKFFSKNDLPKNE